MGLQYINFQPNSYLHSPLLIFCRVQGHPKRPVVRSLADNSSFLAIKSFTSQFDQMNFPFRNSASGLTAQTMKFAHISTTDQNQHCLISPYPERGMVKDSLSSNGITTPTSLAFSFILVSGTPGCTIITLTLGFSKAK